MYHLPQVNYQIFDENFESESVLEKLRRVAAGGKSREYNHPIISWQPYWINPELFFWADGQTLKCLGLGLELSFKPGVQWSKKERNLIGGYYCGLENPQDQDEVLCTIYHHLNTRKFTKYYKALLRFKWETGLLSFPLFDCYENIYVMNGKMFGKCAVQCSNGENRELHGLLNEEFVDRVVSLYCGKKIRDSLVGEKLANCLRQLHKSELLQEPQSAFQKRYQWGVTEYIPSLKLMNLRGAAEKPMLSAQGEHCLRQLTGGSIQALDDIAALVARLCIADMPSDYLWVICGEKDARSRFVQWILTLVDGKFGIGFYDGETKKSNLQLMQEQVCGIPLQMNVKPMSWEEFGELNHARMQRFLNGGVVGKISDAYIADAEVKGKSVLFFIADTLQEGQLKRIPYKAIRVPANWENRFAREDNRWVLSCLVAHGLRLLEGKPEEKKNVVTYEEAVKMFCDKFCSHREGFYTKCAYFHECFVRYASECLSVKDKLKKATTTVRIAREYTGWKKKERHTSKTECVDHFWDVYMDVERVDEELEAAQNKVVLPELDYDSHLADIGELLIMSAGSTSR